MCETTDAPMGLERAAAAATVYATAVRRGEGVAEAFLALLATLPCTVCGAEGECRGEHVLGTARPAEWRVGDRVVVAHVRRVRTQVRVALVNAAWARGGRDTRRFLPVMVAGTWRDQRGGLWWQQGGPVG